VTRRARRTKPPAGTTPGADAAELARAVAILSAQRKAAERAGRTDVSRLLWRASKLVRQAQSAAHPDVAPTDEP
jgi:hypothetical protein